MCKIFVLTNTTHLTHEKMSKLLYKASKVMGKSDDQGFGWVTHNGVAGRVVGEKCLDPEFFENAFYKPPMPEAFEEIVSNTVKGSQNFGKLPTAFSGGLLIHARISTNSISLMNTHPFVNSDWAMIHNGIVYNEGDKYEQKTTCDSEHILHHLTTGGIEAVQEHITGYYAVGAINRKTGETLVMKDDMANLHACYIPFLDSMAFSTNAEQLRTILRDIGFQHSRIKEVVDNQALLFDRAGNLLSRTEIKPRKKSYYDQEWEENYWASRGYGGPYSTTETTTPSEYTPGISGWEQIGNVWQRKANSLPAVIGNPATVGTSTEGTTTRSDHSREASAVLATYRRFDFTDKNGDRIPLYRLDDQYLFYDSKGNPMSAHEFMNLTDGEQDFCEVMDTKTGEMVARLAS